MGLFDDLANELAGNLDLGSISEMLSQNPELVNAALSLLNPEDGSVGGGNGLQDVLNKLASSGLADQVSSWLGSGPNHAVSGDSIASALDADTLNQFALKAGIDLGQAGQALATILPGLIDTLSPQGQAPSGDQLGRLLGSLGSSLQG